MGCYVLCGHFLDTRYCFFVQNALLKLYAYHVIGGATAKSYQDLHKASAFMHGDKEVGCEAGRVLHQ